MYPVNVSPNFNCKRPSSRCLDSRLGRVHREANKAKSFQNTALIVSTIVYRGGLASRALCENKRAKIKFIDYAAEANDAISAVGIVEILEENLERMEFSQHRKSGSGGN